MDLQNLLVDLNQFIQLSSWCVAHSSEIGHTAARQEKVVR